MNHRKWCFAWSAACSIFASSVLNAQDVPLRGGALTNGVNSPEEDYAPYVVYGGTQDTLYFTSGREIGGRQRRSLNAELMYCLRPVELRDELPPNEGWSFAQPVIIRDSTITSYTRGAIAIAPDSQRAVFTAQHSLVADHTAGVIGTSYNLQLWQVRREADGTWGEAEELASIADTASWNSQPAFSSDGRTLYFVSNRTGGVGGLDIWYARYDANSGWSKPRVVPGINTPGNEVSPHCGTDGKFYFASDWDRAARAVGTSGRDIYRSDFKIIGGVNLPSHPVNIDSAIRRDARALGITIPSSFAVNSAGNDEFPCIGRGRSAIFFSSDRAGGAGKRDLYALELPRPRVFLYVSVRERTIDSAGSVLVPAHDKALFPVSVTDSATGEVRTMRAGEKDDLEPDHTYIVSIDPRVQDECYNNKLEGAEQQIVRTGHPLMHDTTHIRNFLFSRRPVEIAPIVFYSTDTLPYFITGYWWPNTSANLREYRIREASGFFDRSGFVDSSGHDYESISRRIDIDFETRVYEPLLTIMRQFDRNCGDTLYLKVTVHGYTDPRGLSTGTDHSYRKNVTGGREYPDSTVVVGADERGIPDTIPRGINMWTHVLHGSPLPEDGQSGNILLSKLRAQFTFATFDRDMRRLSNQYAELRRQHRVLLDAEGFGEDTEGFRERHLRDDPQSRRIEIYLDVLRKEELPFHKRLKGGAIKGKK